MTVGEASRIQTTSLRNDSALLRVAQPVTPPPLSEESLLIASKVISRDPLDRRSPRILLGVPVVTGHTHGRCELRKEPIEAELAEREAINISVI